MCSLPQEPPSHLHAPHVCARTNTHTKKQCPTIHTLFADRELDEVLQCGSLPQEPPPSNQAPSQEARKRLPAGEVERRPIDKVCVCLCVHSCFFYYLKAQSRAACRCFLPVRQSPFIIFNLLALFPFTLQGEGCSPCPICYEDMEGVDLIQSAD